jgi:hypothetical protein
MLNIIIIVFCKFIIKDILGKNSILLLFIIPKSLYNNGKKNLYNIIVQKIIEIIYMIIFFRK